MDDGPAPARPRQVMTSLEVDEAWLAAADPDSPDWLRQWLRETVDAYRTGDLERVLEPIAIPRSRSSSRENCPMRAPIAAIEGGDRGPARLAA